MKSDEFNLHGGEGSVNKSDSGIYEMDKMLLFVDQLESDVSLLVGDYDIFDEAGNIIHRVISSSSDRSFEKTSELEKFYKNEGIAFLDEVLENIDKKNVTGPLSVLILLHKRITTARIKLKTLGTSKPSESRVLTRAGHGNGTVKAHMIESIVDNFRGSHASSSRIAKRSF